MSHTILLIQRSKSENSRTYKEYPNPAAAMAGIVDLFEEKLKRGSNKGTVSYTLADLEAFVEECADFVALLFKPKEGVYAPKSKDWIKTGLERHVLALGKKATSS